ncbi:MAG TPA: lytic murein transglycosylase [Alphaproteobacteria bacterium]|nr:lytic murein transglycosylase [Alphaproteobacteria bacterium]
MTLSRLSRFPLVLAPIAALALSGCAASSAADTFAGAAATAPAQSFESWLADFKAYARTQGVSSAVVERAFADVQPLPQVVEANTSQPEFQRPVWAYLEAAASESRISRGRAHLTENANLLNAVSGQYGVPPEILVAIWGLESDYGNNYGNLSVIDALATLAWQGDRADYAREQLLTVLRILERGDIAPERMIGSWAGAMGQTQFIPTTFASYAVDQDGDGRRDLWGSLADVFASTANYLAVSGWQPGLAWGREVRLPSGFDYGQTEMSVTKPVGEWRRLGVEAVGGTLPPDAAEASVIAPAGHRGPAFLVTDNFRAILRYNNATSYALAVGHLSDRLAGAGPIRSSWPTGDQPLSRTDRMDLQRLLMARGYDPGGVDGVVGRMTRAAIRDFQRELGRPADGYPTMELLNRLRQLGDA